MSNLPLVFKTSTKAWVYGATADTVTQITDVNYPGSHTYSISSLTSVTTTATAVTSAAHGLSVGDSVTIAGATQTEYNGTYTVVTAADTTHFTYTFAGSATSPATGTITAVDGRTTVAGVIYLDGTYYVMDSNGIIYGSNIDDPFTWVATNFISAEVEQDNGVALVKYLNYAVAFGVWTTEFFYDAAIAAPASPLLRLENAFLQIGCAHARSIAQAENSIVWMANGKEGSAGASAGRSIQMLTQFQSKQISTQYIDRLLNADSLAGVYAMAFKHQGHSFYALTLTNTNITLVYDFATGLWYQWTSMTAQAALTGTALTYSTTSGLVTATKASHGYADGDVVVVSGATQTQYNGTYNITYVDANTYTYTPTTAPSVTPATGTILTVGYTEGHFRLRMHSTIGATNYFLDESNGYIYTMAESNYDDNGTYINFIVRTPNLDASSNEPKEITKQELIGDRVSAHALLRYTKDDYQTFSKYRKVDLSTYRSALNRIGRARRAAFDVRITDSVAIRLERMDISYEGENK